MLIEKGNDLNSVYNKSGDMSANNIILYANYITFGSPEQSLFSEDTYTTLYVKNDYQKMEGLMINKQINTDIIIRVNRIDKSQMKLRNSTSFAFMGDVNVMELFDEKTVIFTVGEPLNIEKYEKAEQEVFVSNSTFPTELNQIDEDMDEKLVEALQNLEEGENKTVYNLTNIELINNINNSNVKFVIGSPIVNPTVLKITYDRNWGMHRIFAKGYVDGDFIELNLKLGEMHSGLNRPLNPLMALVKMFPVATQNKVVNMSNTLDFNFSPPFDILKEYVGISKGLRKWIITSETQWKKDLWKVFLSILELTKAFSNSFSDYIIKGTDGRAGIDPNATVGGIKIGLLSGISSNDAIPSISGRINDWINKNPQYVNSGEFKVFRSFLFLLSQYVQCDEALGGGLTRAHEIYNIFYFDLRTAIVKGLADKDTTDIIVQLKSRYYDINNKTGDLTIKDNFQEISKYQILDINGQANIAEMPEEITPLNYISKAGDISPTSEDISKFMIYMPVSNQEELKKVYGISDKSSSVDPGGVIEKEVNKDGQENGNEEKYFFSTGQPSNIPSGWYYQPNTTGHCPTVNWGPIPSADVAFDLDFIKDPIYIFANFIRMNLASNEEIKYIGNIPDVRNIKLVKSSIKKRTECQKYNDLPGTSNDGYKLKYYIGIDWTLTFDYTIIQKTTKPPVDIDDLVLIGDLPSFDKRTYLQKVKKHYDKDTIEWVLDFNYINPNEVVESINQLVLVGMYGNQFNIKISNGTDNLILNNLEFLSKYDETKTKTKINF